MEFCWETDFKYNSAMRVAIAAPEEATALQMVSVPLQHTAHLVLAAVLICSPKRWRLKQQFLKVLAMFHLGKYLRSEHGKSRSTCLYVYSAGHMYHTFWPVLAARILWETKITSNTQHLGNRRTSPSHLVQTHFWSSARMGWWPSKGLKAGYEAGASLAESSCSYTRPHVTPLNI